MVDTNGENSIVKKDNNKSTPINDEAQTPVSHNVPKSTPEDAERIAIELEKPYLYQNRRTGQPSTSPLTARQLCRLLCPAVNGSIMRSSTMIVTPETLVIGYDISTGQYSADGWIPARKTPVLRESCSSWHYEEVRGKIKGPVSCRDLAAAMMEKRSKEKKESMNAWENVRVWSTEMAQLEKDAEKLSENKEQQKQQQQQWRKISELIFLKAAMEAFEDTPPPWELDNNKNGGKKARQVDNVKGEHATPTMKSEEEFDPSIMTYDAGTDVSTKEGNDSGTKTTGLSTEKGTLDGEVISAPSNNLSKSEAEELEAFLSSTANMGPTKGNGENDDEEEGYESDGGTSYVKDPRTGNWIHAALAPPKPSNEDAVPPNDKKASTNSANSTTSKRRKRKKANFSTKNAKCWVYVTGLPKDTNEDEVATYFARVGVLDLDPSTQHPKVKLYREKSEGKNGGSLKGDASICYARPESVDMALQFLDDSPFRADSGTDRIKVQRAKFEQHGEQFHETKGRFSNAQRKVARLAALQAVGWDEGENGRITGGKKGLRIIVLKNMFHPDELTAGGSDKEDAALMELEHEVHSECEKHGAVEKITLFSKNPSGVMVIKFAQPGAASDAISEYHGRTRKGWKIDASFWDGVTDYTIRDVEKEQKEMDQRHDEFGNWLESQEVPEELRLKVEGDSH